MTTIVRPIYNKAEFDQCCELWADSVRPFRILMEFENTYSTLAWDERQLRVMSGGPLVEYEDDVRISQSDFIRCLFQGAAACTATVVRNSSTLQSMFPNQSGILWSTDFF